MYRNRILSTLVGAGLAALSLGRATNAASIEPGLYQVGNHPDGAAADPGYGLRLDELINVTSGNDVFTFDFEDKPGTAMYLEYNGTSIHIFGIAYGGLDVGDDYHWLLKGYVEIDFTYSVVESAPGDDDLIVTTPDFTNTGTIKLLGLPIGTDLFDFSGNNGYTFRLGDENNDLGHRGFAGISGWGWLNHHYAGNQPAGDWLFTAQLIPLPPAGVLGLAGLAGLAWRRRRSSKRSA